LSCGLALAEDQDTDDAHQMRAATPIKHVIVLIGENWSFDSIYATYKRKHGQMVGNLLSRGIVREDGTAGPNFSRSVQFQINQPYPATYFIDSQKTAGKTAYVKAPMTPSFPPPNTAYVPSAPGGLSQSLATARASRWL
jgi:phospholipase C